MMPFRQTHRSKARMIVPATYTPDELARLADLERANDALVQLCLNELPEAEAAELRSAQRLVVELIENYR